MMHRAAIAAAVALCIGGCSGAQPKQQQNPPGERNIGSPEVGATTTSVFEPHAPPQRQPDDGHATSGGATGLAPLGNRYAVLIGVSNYADGSIPALEYARSDAEDLCAFFLDPTGLAMAPENVRILRDKEATLDAIQKKIKEINDVATPLDTVWVYYAGHGAVDIGPKGELLGNYLLPYDAKAISKDGGLALDTSTGLAIAELQKMLSVNQAAKLILVLDCCFSGGSTKNFSRVHLDTRQADASEHEIEGLKDTGAGRAVLTATAANQPALELAELKGGLFTHYLIEGFNYDSNRDSKVSLDEVVDYIQMWVRNEARKLGREQTPSLKVNRTTPIEVRDLPRTKFQVNLKVRYGEKKPIEAFTDATDRPTPVEDPTSYAVEVDPWISPAPIYVYVLRFALTPGTVPTSERLLPDGENTAAPAVTVATNRSAVYPVEAESGAAMAPVRTSEANAYVLYVLVASQTPVPLAILDRTEGKLLKVAAETSAQPAGFARRAAALIEAEPELKHVALRYLFVKHSTKTIETKGR